MFTFNHNHLNFNINHYINSITFSYVVWIRIASPGQMNEAIQRRSKNYRCFFVHIFWLVTDS